MIHDEKTTELEIPPKPLAGVGRTVATPLETKAAELAQLSPQTETSPAPHAQDEWVLRLALLIGILSLSLLLL